MRNPDPFSIIATANPAMPAYDLMRMLNDVGAVNRELQTEIMGTRDRNVFLSRENFGLAHRAKWFEDESQRRQNDINNLLTTIREQRLDLDRRDETIRQHVITIRELRDSHADIDAQVTGVRATVNELGKHLPKLLNGTCARDTLSQANV